MLIVLSIISVLMTIAYLSLNFTKNINNVKADKIASDFSSIEKAFIYTNTERLGEKVFPLDSEIGNEINQIIENKEITYLSKLKANIDSGSDNKYYYSNDGNKYEYTNSCPADASESTAGANVVLKNINDANNNEIILKLDKIFDNSDGLKCGKIRTVNNSELWYNMSEN